MGVGNFSNIIVRLGHGKIEQKRNLNAIILVYLSFRVAIS